MRLAVSSQNIKMLNSFHTYIRAVSLSLSLYIYIPGTTVTYHAYTCVFVCARNMSLLYEPYRSLFTSAVNTHASWESDLQCELSELRLVRERDLEPIRNDSVRESRNVIKLL